MSYSGSLLKLNGQTINKIIDYDIQRNKLWSSDSGRNMAGSMKGSLVGNFPKLLLNIGPTTEAEMRALELILDEAVIEVEYYNNKYGCTCTADFYAGDYKESLKKQSSMKYKPFTVNLIPNEREDKHVRNSN